MRKQQHNIEVTKPWMAAQGHSGLALRSNENAGSKGRVVRAMAHAVGISVTTLDHRSEIEVRIAESSRGSAIKAMLPAQ